MKNVLLSLSFILVGLFAYAQTSFRTGSASLDTDLSQINANAKLDFGAFKTDLSLSYNVSKSKIDYLRTNVNMQPAEIYFALEIGKVTRKSVDEVVRVYKLHKSKGWGYIAKQLGIKPGSDAFHRLKNNAKERKHKKNKHVVKSKGKGSTSSMANDPKSPGKGKGKKK